MKHAKNLFWTTLLLTASSFVMKTVAVWFNVYLTGKIGASGIGLWSLILSVYFMLKTVSSAGMSLLSTRLIIDRPQCLRSNLKKLYLSALGLGSFGMLLLLTGAPWISLRFLNTWEGAKALRLLALSLPCIAMSTCTGGYSTAKRKMGRYALLQVAEQGVRMGVSIFALSLPAAQTTVGATSALALGIVISEAFSLLAGGLFVLWDLKGTDKGQPSTDFSEKVKSIALPDGAGSILRSLLSTVQNLLIPRGMRKNGASNETALAAYGIVHGMALPVVLYPSSLLGVLSGLLVPEIAEGKANRHWGHIRYLIYRVLHPALFFSVAVAGVMLGFSTELSLAVYANTDAARFILILAPLVPVMYMDMTCDGLLKGLGMQKVIMGINLADSILSVIMIYFLVPKMGIYGYVFMVWFTELFNFLFSFLTLLRVSRFSLRRLKGALLMPLMSLSSLIVTHTLCRFFSFSSATGECAVKIIMASLLYLLFSIGAGIISRENLRWFKKILK